MTCKADLEAMRRALAEVDPSSLSPRAAEDLLAEAVGVANAAWALAGRTAVRVGETDAFRRCGDRTEAHHLGRVAGVGLGAARLAVEVAGGVAGLAAQGSVAVGEALRQGELSIRQAAAIADAVAADPKAEARLLRLAKARGISQLEEECARVRAAACPQDQKDKHRKARNERGAWKHTNRDGSAEIRFRSSPDDVSEAWSIIGAFRDRLFRATQATAAERKPTFDQSSADAFLDMARAAAATCGATVPRGANAGPSGRSETASNGAGPHGSLAGATQPTLDLEGLPADRPAPTPKKVIVRVDLAALLRGYPTEGETCDIPGYGPVPVDAVRDMIATGNPVLAAVITKGVDVATVAHLGRSPTAHQRTAMQWLDPRCKAEGCDRTMGLEVDHRIDWHPTQVTLLGWLEWLCSHHHSLKTNQGWRLVPGKGIRPFVPPNDPRHPNHSPPPPSQP